MALPLLPTKKAPSGGAADHQQFQRLQQRGQMAAVHGEAAEHAEAQTMTYPTMTNNALTPQNEAGTGPIQTNPSNDFKEKIYMGTTIA
jgi:hypothetical protein